jgi:hypothetical protein
MSEQKNFETFTTPDGSSETPAEDVEAAISAGGEIIGTTEDDEPLVEGPNSK